MKTKLGYAKSVFCDRAISLQLIVKDGITHFSKNVFLSHLSWQQQTDIKSFTNSLSIREFHSLAP